MQIKALLHKINNYATSATRSIVGFLDSNKFLYLIVTLFIFQALWIAFSFRYPLIYDEIRHVPIIEIFAQRLSPFITDQPPKYDQYGSLNLATGFTASFYHYLMSFPYRFIDIFTNEFVYKVLFLRSLNVLLVAAGLYLFAKVFNAVGIRRRYTNIGLLIFTLIPIVPFVAAHVNYDNMLFPLTAAFLLFAVRIVRAKRVNWIDYLSFVTIGCLATLIKFTFLPILAAGVLFITLGVYRKYGLKTFFVEIKQSIKHSRRWVTISMGAMALVTVSIFSLIYIQNFAVYGTPRPKCNQVMSAERCLKSDIAKRNMQAEKTKYERPLMPLPEYVTHWVENMMLATNFSVSAVTSEGIGDRKRPLPLIYSVVFFGTIFALMAILFAWHRIRHNNAWNLLIFVALVLIGAVFARNYSIYLDLHAAYATQPRYLLSVTPIVIVMAVVAIAYILRNRNIYTKLFTLLILLLLLSQGGGVITHILSSESTWYWEDSRVIDANNSAKQILEPLVNEK